MVKWSLAGAAALALAATAAQAADGKPIVIGIPIGLSGANMIILAMTLLLSTLTFTGTRTTMLEGAVHLSVFFVFLVLVFSP